MKTTDPKPANRGLSHLEKARQMDKSRQMDKTRQRNKAPINVKVIRSRVTLFLAIFCVLLTLAGIPWAIASLSPSLSLLVQTWPLVVVAAWAGSRVRSNGDRGM